MKILIVTDAWTPQVNGVVTTLKNTAAELTSRGYEVVVIEPNMFPGIPMPGYPEIKLCCVSQNQVSKCLGIYQPDYVHIATEGPVGLAFRRGLRKRGWSWSSSFHTKFAEYVESRFGFGSRLVWKWLRYVYRDDSKILVTTASMKSELTHHGFEAEKIKVWSRGVDQSVFKFNSRSPQEPVWLNVGRVSVEKNLPAFYEMDLPGIKIQVGDGPCLEEYKAKYPDVEFVGAKSGSELAHYYQNSSVFVFPSKSDTFGLVMIEAMRCGTPVAAYPVTGPIDAVTPGKTGYCSDNLKEAAVRALRLDRKTVRDSSDNFTWTNATDNFVEALVPVSRMRYKAGTQKDLK